MSDIVVRKATKSDSSTLLRLIESLAEYEHLTPPDAVAKERLISDMFRENPRIEASLAFADETPAGYTLMFETYSSFLARPTLFLEDLFVLPEYRGKGVGYALFKALVAEADRRGCGRVEWAVLDWNKLAIEFYERLGATHLKEWLCYRLTSNEFRGVLEK